MNKKEIGRIGEDLCCDFLVNNGFEIISRNYQKRIGEIDIIAFKRGILHFFEVKTVSRETFSDNIIRNYKPEDNVTCQKINKIEKTANLFLFEKGFDQGCIQIDLLTVYLIKSTIKPKIEKGIVKPKYFIKYFPNINFI